MVDYIRNYSYRCRPAVALADQAGTGPSARRHQARTPELYVLFPAHHERHRVAADHADSVDVPPLAGAMRAAPDVAEGTAEEQQGQRDFDASELRGQSCFRVAAYRAFDEIGEDQQRRPSIGAGIAPQDAE